MSIYTGQYIGNVYRSIYTGQYIGNRWAALSVSPGMEGRGKADKNIIFPIPPTNTVARWPKILLNNSKGR